MALRPRRRMLVTCQLANKARDIGDCFLGQLPDHGACAFFGNKFERPQDQKFNQTAVRFRAD